MSSGGRGRGYSGRHHARRPGDDEPAPRIDISPRATVVPTPEARDKEKRDMESEKEIDPPDLTSEDDAVLKELLTIDEQYQPLLLLLEQFSPSEDGIQFNRKLRHFETTITNMCPDENRLHGAFATFRAAALLSGATGRKLAAVGASFTRQQRQQLLRTALLNVIMQGTYAKLDVLERANPMFLINAANLMGDYFSEARLCNGNKVHILAAPLLHYMRALLASDDIKAHRSLATQLMQNGRELLSILSQELDELTVAIRQRILSPPPCGIIWLLLSSDMCLNKFLPLPITLQQFYAAHLKLTSDDSYNEVNYGSWKKSPEKDEKTELTDKIGANISNISLVEDDTKPKLRPILGAGAGLLRQEQMSVSQDSFETWTSPKSSLTKRYDLNSWRQAEEEKKQEPEFDPTVLPPNFTEFPPPRYNYQENFNNYLQQGDGAYIQNQYYQEYNQYPEREKNAEREIPESQNQNQERGDRTVIPDRDKAPEKVQNEVQKSVRKPIENWRKEKVEIESKKQVWIRQKSKDNVNEEEKKIVRNSRDPRPGNRMNRRSSGDNESSGKTPPRRHVSDVPRNHKYWDHDDRCDKDYNS